MACRRSRHSSGRKRPAPPATSLQQAGQQTHTAYDGDDLNDRNSGPHLSWGHGSPDGIYSSAGPDEAPGGLYDSLFHITIDSFPMSAATKKPPFHAFF